MAKHSTMDSVLARVRGKGRGSVWSPKNFLDLGARAAIDQTLSRLVRRGVLRRVARGLYDIPVVSTRLGQMSPDVDAVARASAMTVGARIQPTGAAAANALGLSSQVPARQTYITDRSSRRITVGNQVVHFRHAAPSRLLWGPVIHALAHLGPHGVNDAVIQRLRQQLIGGDRKRLLGDDRLAPDWMRRFLVQLSTPGPGDG